MKRGPIFLLALSVVLMAMAFLVWPRPRMTSYDGLAMDVLQDILEGDSSSYCAMVADEELKTYQITRQQCSALIEEQLTPLLNRHVVNKSAFISSTSTVGSWHASATIYYQINGYHFAFHVTVQEELGRPTTKLSSRVIGILHLKGLEMLPPGRKDFDAPCIFALARSLALHRHAVPLERYGITKVVSWNTMGMPMDERTLDELLTSGIKWLHEECPPHYARFADSVGLPKHQPETIAE